MPGSELKLCRGPSHPEGGALVRIDRFPRRNDRPCGRHSRCADCTNYERVQEHHGPGGHGYELVSRYLWVFTELRNRLGVVETARRVGMSRSGLRLLLNGTNRRVRRRNLRAAVQALRAARERGEVYSRASIHYGRRPGYMPRPPQHARDYVHPTSDLETEQRRALKRRSGR